MTPPTSSDIVNDSVAGSAAFIGSDFYTGSTIFNSLPGMLSYNVTAQLDQFFSLLGLS
ncbi:hypothetical protein CCANI_05860 [Corynebacterium canis]|uniref:hypothetical protein n=1 Tax=Corynebacterium canis TaxID=679663 RepID=UPI001647A363|nr:hypothetical protein [Corynebacterium canis]WJY75018.1 hypothetical protein CCANI_05860 [Corynebacterium canis]